MTIGFVSMKFFCTLSICLCVIIFIECSIVNLSTQPMNSEATIIEGDDLEVICDHGNSKLRFPHLSGSHGFWSNRVFSPVEVSPHEVTGKKVLTKRRAVHGDTGEYQCIHPGFDGIDKMSSIYIFVESNTSYFVEDIVTPIPKFVINKKLREFGIRDSVMLSCQPTSSAFELRMEKDGLLFEPYPNPRKNYVFVENPGSYKCILKLDGRVVAIKEYNITEVDDDLQLKIPEGENGHFDRSKPFRVKCMAVYAHNWQVHRGNPYLTWDIDKNDGVHYKTNLFPKTKHPTIANYEILIKELEILSIVDDISRNLTCTMTYKVSNNQTAIEMSTSMSLDVKPHNSGRKLLSKDCWNNETYVGDEARFVVLIGAHLHTISITWLDPKGRKIITDGKKFFIGVTNVVTMLKIRNLSLEDTGKYIVQAESPVYNFNEILSFDLDIWENKLIKKIDNVKTYYMRDEFVRVNCIVRKYPSKPVVTWSFRKNLNSPFESSGETKHISSGDTTAVWEMKTSGNIICLACDNKGCEKVEHSIFITDVPDGFGIIPPNRLVMIDDTLELICAASVHHFTEKVEWLDDTGSPLVPSETTSIAKMRTAFTYRVILTIDRITEQNAKNYTCAATNNDEGRKIVSYRLNVHSL